MGLLVQVMVFRVALPSPKSCSPPFPEPIHESDWSSQFLKQLSLCSQELPWLLVQTLAVTEQTPINQICWAHTLLQVICWWFLAEPKCLWKQANTEPWITKLSGWLPISSPPFLVLKIFATKMGCSSHLRGGSSTCLWFYLFLMPFTCGHNATLRSPGRGLCMPVSDVLCPCEVAWLGSS